MHELATAGAELLPLDLCSERSIAAAVNQILDQHGHLDVIVNNAGYGAYGALEDVSIARCSPPHGFQRWSMTSGICERSLARSAKSRNAIPGSRS